MPNHPSKKKKDLIPNHREKKKKRVTIQKLSKSVLKSIRSNWH